MNKAPNIRVIDYVVLVQSGVAGVDEIPSDIKNEVISWLSFFTNGSMPVSQAPAPTNPTLNNEVQANA